MSTDFKILSINNEAKTMVIDWGFVTLNHDIPLYILEHPEITQDEVIRQISYMRPPMPTPAQLPDALLSLVAAAPDQYPAEEELTL
ncbi:hypothetical protein [Metapseudomonas otitidis]|uniref:hypothetical protein n=1 Tax=Metapseudomonas otitidis TaxID=319939 RepID=UPI000D1A5850|nr:hypothetical protein [Pseudomonas otitidis]